MTPEEKRQFNLLKKKVTDLERATNPFAVDVLKERFFEGSNTYNSTNGDIDTVTSVGAGGGSVTHPRVPDLQLLVRFKGKIYVVPAYNYSRAS